MTPLRTFLARLRGLGRDQRIEADLREQIEAHLAEATEDFMKQGVSREAARRAALVRFGGVAQVQELHRGLRRFAWLDELARDARLAVRNLLRTPHFSAVVILILALGTGATVNMLAIVDAVVLRPLPFDQDDRLVAFGRELGASSPAPLVLGPIDNRHYRTLLERQDVFDSLAAYDGRSASATIGLRAPGLETEDLRVLRVTTEFFDVLGVAAALGRILRNEDAFNGQHRVAVLSDGFWRRRFGADPEIVGRLIQLDDASYEVVGVLRPGVTYPVGAVPATDLWIPHVVQASNGIYLRGIARLRTGIGPGEAQQRLGPLLADSKTALGVYPLRDYLVGASTRSWLLMLLGAVALVQLIVYGNVAGAVVIRTTARQREIAVRAALGASRWQILRMLTTEMLVLALLGTALAMVCSVWTVPLVRDALPEGLPRVGTIALGVRVVTATLGLTLVAALCFGVAAAIPLTRSIHLTSLRSDWRLDGHHAGRQRLQSALVIGEVALAVVLLVGAALFSRSFLNVHGINPGFSPDRVLTMQIEPRSGTRVSGQDLARVLGAVAGQVDGLHGVASAAVISGGMPLARGVHIRALVVPDRSVQSENGVNVRAVTPGYHTLLGTPVLKGRSFGSDDRAGGPPVVVVNNTVATRHFPNEDPIGRTVEIGRVPHVIVGVVGDVRYRDLETEPAEVAYVPLAQGAPWSNQLLVRTAGNPSEAFPAIKSAVHGVLPDAALRDVRTLEAVMARQLAPRQLNMLLLGMLGALGLGIAAIGIYGCMQLWVSQRTHELGVRLALGASPDELLRLVLTRGGLMVAVGLTLGCLAAWLVRTVAGAFLFGVDPGDPKAFVSAMALLLLVGVVAVLIPARRATRVDPIAVLRAQ